MQTFCAELERLERHEHTIAALEKLARAVLSAPRTQRLSEWERDFLSSVYQQLRDKGPTGWEPSDKQCRVILRIEDRLGGLAGVYAFARLWKPEPEPEPATPPIAT
jgi:hypothetical protein